MPNMVYARPSIGAVGEASPFHCKVETLTMQLRPTNQLYNEIHDAMEVLERENFRPKIILVDIPTHEAIKNDSRSGFPFRLDIIVTSRISGFRLVCSPEDEFRRYCSEH